MSLKMTPKIVQNEPPERTLPQTPPGGAPEPQNLIKQTKNTPGETCQARRTESAASCVKYSLVKQLTKS